MAKFIIGALMLFIAARASGQQPKFSPAQRQVWSMEEKYWEFMKALDRDGYVSLWDESFVGWPYPLPDPIRKDVIRLDPFSLLQGGTVKNVQLEPKAVQVFDDVAVVYYIVVFTNEKKDGSIEVQGLRITHTWRRTKQGWLIISGMSAPAQPSEIPNPA